MTGGGQDGGSHSLRRAEAKGQSSLQDCDQSRYELPEVSPEDMHWSTSGGLQQTFGSLCTLEAYEKKEERRKDLMSPTSE